MLTTKKTILFALIIIILLAFTGCIPGDGTNTSRNPAGFFWGIWHGWMAPISLIVSFFNRTIRVYEVNNIGWVYDFGFYISIISGFGGFSFFRDKRK